MNASTRDCINKIGFNDDSYYLSDKEKSVFFEFGDACILAVNLILKGFYRFF